MRIFCHIVTYASFVLSIISVVIMCCSFKKRYLRKVSKIPDKGIISGVERLGAFVNKEELKRRKSVADCYIKILDEFGTVTFCFLAVGIIPCFFDGVSVNQDAVLFSLPVFFSMLFVTAVLSVIFTTVAAKKLDIKLDRSFDKKFMAYDAGVSECKEDRLSLMVADVIVSLHAAITAYIFIIDFIL